MIRCRVATMNNKTGTCQLVVLKIYWLLDSTLPGAFFLMCLWCVGRRSRPTPSCVRCASGGSRCRVARRLLCRRASVSCSDLQLEFAQAIARAPAHLCMPACATLTSTPARPPPPHHESRISRSVNFSRARKRDLTNNALRVSAYAHRSASIHSKFLPPVTSYARFRGGSS
jgi:hypothetical protein